MVNGGVGDNEVGGNVGPGVGGNVGAGVGTRAIGHNSGLGGLRSDCR